MTTKERAGRLRARARPLTPNETLALSAAIEAALQQLACIPAPTNLIPWPEDEELCRLRQRAVRRNDVQA